MKVAAEIDKSGRLVIPKKLRDAHHLTPGTRVTFDDQGNGILLKSEAKPRGLYMKNGMPVFYTGRTIPPDAVNWIERDYEERAEEALGEWKSS